MAAINVTTSPGELGIISYLPAGSVAKTAAFEANPALATAVASLEVKPAHVRNLAVDMASEAIDLLDDEELIRKIVACDTRQGVLNTATHRLTVLGAALSTTPNERNIAKRTAWALNKTVAEALDALAAASALDSNLVFEWVSSLPDDDLVFAASRLFAMSAFQLDEPLVKVAFARIDTTHHMWVDLLNAAVSSRYRVASAALSWDGPWNRSIAAAYASFASADTHPTTMAKPSLSQDAEVELRRLNAWNLLLWANAVSDNDIPSVLAHLDSLGDYQRAFTIASSPTAKVAALLVDHADKNGWLRAERHTYSPYQALSVLLEIADLPVATAVTFAPHLNAHQCAAWLFGGSAHRVSEETAELVASRIRSADAMSFLSALPGSRAMRPSDRPQRHELTTGIAGAVLRGLFENVAGLPAHLRDTGWWSGTGYFRAYVALRLADEFGDSPTQWASFWTMLRTLGEKCSFSELIDVTRSVSMTS